jgi:hypothetical protein
MRNFHINNKIFALLLGFFLCSAFSTIDAQVARFKAGQLQANAGIGLISTFAADAPTTIVPPLSGSLEYFLSPNLSLGLYAAYSEAEGERTYQNAGIIESFNNKTWMAALRMGFHSNNLDNWRVYGGLMMGTSLPTVEKQVRTIPGEFFIDDDAPSFSRPAQNSFLFSGYVGARRYLRPDWSVFGEVGFGISLVNLGFSYHL